MQAVMKQAIVPAISARITVHANAGRRCGVNAPMPPSCTPTEPKLANPHRA